MKIKVTHDKTWWYVAELVGVEWAYTQWKTPKEAVEYLFGVYRTLQEIKKEDTNTITK